MDLQLLPLLFLAAGFAELASIIYVGRLLGVLPTLALLVIAAMAGMSVIRSTGLGLAQAMDRQQLEGRFATEMAGRSLLRFVAGVLLMIPGFLTDLAAAVLLVPPVQKLLLGRLAAFVRLHPASQARQPTRPGPVIEGEAVEIHGEIVDPPADTSHS